MKSLNTSTLRESPESDTMSLTEEQRARMERMKKVAQEKKKWKDKASHGGGISAPPSGGQGLSRRMSAALSYVQGNERGVPISQSVQGEGVQKAPVTVDRVALSSVALPSSSTAGSASDFTSGNGVSSIFSSSSSGSDNHQSSLAARLAPSEGSIVATKPASAFYKPQAAQPPLPRGNFRPQEQPSTFKHQASSKV